MSQLAQKTKRIVDEIERAKAKIAELQALIPELERKKTALENDEIVRVIRSLNIPMSDIPEFLEGIRAVGAPPSAPPRDDPRARMEAGNGADKSTPEEENDV